MSVPRIPAGDDYPFGTGDWDKWSNKKRLDWLTNFRDKSILLKDKFEISDEMIAQMIEDVDAMERGILHEEYVAARDRAQKAPNPRESARMLGEVIDDICANDYYKARRIGFTDEQIDQLRADADKYARDIEEWERRQNAKMILGYTPPAKTPPKPIEDDVDPTAALHVLMALKGIDDTALKAAFASGDEEAADREFTAWISKLEEKADADPIFAKWFEEFRDDQERLLRWDDMIGDEDEDDDEESA